MIASLHKEGIAVTINFICLPVARIFPAWHFHILVSNYSTQSFSTSFHVEEIIPTPLR